MRTAFRSGKIGRSDEGHQHEVAPGYAERRKGSHRNTHTHEGGTEATVPQPDGASTYEVWTKRT